MVTSHEPGTPRYPEDPDVMEAGLIEEITQLQALLGPDLLGPRSRYENLAGAISPARGAPRPPSPADYSKLGSGRGTSIAT